MRFKKKLQEIRFKKHNNAKKQQISKNEILFWSCCEESTSVKTQQGQKLNLFPNIFERTQKNQVQKQYNRVKKATYSQLLVSVFWKILKNQAQKNLAN